MRDEDQAGASGRRGAGEVRTPDDAYRAGLVAAEAMGLSGKAAERMAVEAASAAVIPGGRVGRIDPKGMFRRHFDEIVVNFGRHKGKTLRSVAEHAPGYLRWILNHQDRRMFGEEARRIVREALEGGKGAKTGAAFAPARRGSRRPGSFRAPWLRTAAEILWGRWSVRWARR